MKFTLSECVNRINQALNFPSYTYTDVYAYLDAALMELNSTLRIELPSITEIRENYELHADPECIALADPTESITMVDAIPTGAQAYTYCYVKGFGENPEVPGYYVYDGTNWILRKTLKGVKYTNKPNYYVAIKARNSSGNLVCGWEEIPNPGSYMDCNLLDYLPFEWWILFVIPYVAAKLTIRDGGQAIEFTEQYSQGFQQLQTSYDTPNYVWLDRNADRVAYTEIVKERIPNLHIQVPTRAIYPEMKHGDAVQPTWGGFYERSGWGV